ncbi:MAG: tRNA epoxyqueuosine(34) reductase QueG [Zetaproteobacteria bacterium]|nr:tRNA epoxyqueuosine(34) reductase QueG [Pseudobdellovibrionaceae bacterium]|tara:strand:+ start:223 stop:1302 length:1080 start_codon:yes stop_codon:yes gene_type:complete
MDTLERNIIENIINKSGLELFGIVSLEKEQRFDFFSQWLKNKKNAEMDYLQNHLNCRKDPRNILPGSSKAIIIGLSYYQGDKYKRDAPSKIAQYARLKDYHKTIKKKSQDIIDKLRNFHHGPEAFLARSVTDSAPILERALAEKTISGFIGKNTCFIHPQKGSFYLLGEILTNLNITEDQNTYVNPTKRTKQGGCGTCKRCQVYCPTGALDKDYQIDARKCLAYYTIEHRGIIPLEFWPHLKKYFFGCDICQLVCPYNKSIPQISKEKVVLESHPSLYEIAVMDQSFYEKTFGGTPLTRAKISGLKRNALIAMIVGKDSRLSDVINHVKEHDKHIKVLQETLEQYTNSWLKKSVQNPDL